MGITYSDADDKLADRIEHIVNTVLVADDPAAECAKFSNELHNLLREMDEDTRHEFMDDLRGGGDTVLEEPSRLPAPIDDIFHKFSGEAPPLDDGGTISDDLQKFGQDMGDVNPDAN